MTIEPFHVPRGKGATHNIGIDVTVKAGEYRSGHGAAVIEFTTRKGEEPGDHTHPTEDEMFYVVEGELTFECDGRRFDVEAGGFVFLPQGLKHNYTIRTDGAVRLLVITAPPRPGSESWGGFVGDVESAGEGHE